MYAAIAGTQTLISCSDLALCCSMMLHQQEHHTDSLSWRENPRQKSKLFGKAQQEGEEGRKWERGRSGGEEDKRRRESGKEEKEEVQGGGGG